MAYMNQDRKKQLMPGIKAVLEKYKVKATFYVRHHLCLVAVLREGEVNFPFDEEGRVPGVNPYYLESSFSGEALQFLQELHKAMNGGNHDNSDIMSDYFDVGWYTEIRIGDSRTNTPYTYLRGE